MQVLAVDVGTGTQDIYLFRSDLGMENGFKLVMPSPTMLVRRQIEEATSRGEDLLLRGVTMGGGPCAWAAKAHLDAGYRLFATPDAARTFNDDLDHVRTKMGVAIVDEEEAKGLRGVKEILMRDFDYNAIRDSFQAFGFAIDPQAIAVAVFDHGAAPPDISDRQYRFDYLESRLRADNRLSTFAFPAADVPHIMTRMKAVVTSAGDLPCPLVLMDTAPAAILGATLDPKIAAQDRLLVANVGNFHSLAFRLGPTGIEGVFEHHTGLIDCSQLDELISQLARGDLTHTTVFDDHGHGALVLHGVPLGLEDGDFGIAVTGPRREMLRDSKLRPYFAAPFGDMMLTGCFGLLAAVADLMPELEEPIRQSLAGGNTDVAPWDARG